VVGPLDKAWAQVESEGVSGLVTQALLQRRCKPEAAAPATEATKATAAEAVPSSDAAAAPGGGAAAGAASEAGTQPTAAPAEAPATTPPAEPTPAPASTESAAPPAGATPESPPGGAGSTPPPAPAAGRLLVKVSEPGASVLIDGQLVGSSPLAALPLEAGPHVVTVEKVGFARTQKDVDIPAGADVTAELTLLPAGGPVTRAPGSALLRFVGYGVAAAGVVGVGASAALLARDANNESRATQLGWGGLALGITGAALVGLGSDVFGTGSVVAVVPIGAGLAVAATF